MKKQILLLILLFTFWSGCNLYNNPSSTVKKFYEEICDGNLDAAQKRMSATVSLPPEWLRLGLSAAAKECKDNNGLDEVIIKEETITDEKAAVIGEAKYKNGKLSPFGMQLYLEQKEWKIGFNPDAMNKKLNELKK